MMLVEDGQCAAYVTEFGSQFINVTLSVVQGIITFLSIIGRRAVDCELLPTQTTSHKIETIDYTFSSG